MKSITKKRTEAYERAQARAKLSNAQQLESLDARGLAAVKERKRLAK